MNWKAVRKMIWKLLRRFLWDVVMDEVLQNVNDYRSAGESVVPVDTGDK